MIKIDANLFLSVIVPVYNVSDYLPKCIDSIISQKTSEPIEIIMIDDGSTDGSSAICDKYAEHDNRIKVIHKDNGGASDARNTGIRAARGEYLLFIDADDYIYAGSFEKIIMQTKADGGCDVVFLNADTISGVGVLKEWSYKYDKNNIYKRSRIEVLTYINSISRLPVSPCIKLLRHRFIIDKCIFFTDGIVCEDVDHTYKILFLAETFNFYDFPYYCARINRTGSVMTEPKGSLKRFESTLYIIKKWLDKAEKNIMQKELIFGFLAIQFVYLTAMYDRISTIKQKKYKKTVEGLSWLLYYGGSKKFVLIRILYRLFKLSHFSLVTGKILL